MGCIPAPNATTPPWFLATWKSTLKNTSKAWNTLAGPVTKSSVHPLGGGNTREPIATTKICWQCKYIPNDLLLDIIIIALSWWSSGVFAHFALPRVFTVRSESKGIISNCPEFRQQAVALDRDTVDTVDRDTLDQDLWAKLRQVTLLSCARN